MADTDEEQQDHPTEEMAIALATAAALAALMRPEVEAALKIPDPAERLAALRAAAEAVFRIAFEDEGGDPAHADAATEQFLQQLSAAVDHTTPTIDPQLIDDPDAPVDPKQVAEYNKQVDRVTDVFATAAANASALAALEPGAEVTWITMLDDRVRDIHRPLHGITQTAGVPFDVGGTKLLYPGQPVGDPQAWINCRCHLAPAATVAASLDPVDWDEIDAMTARAYDTDKRKKMADSGTAMPDGSFPIADLEDLRNAIQAIGRAKDPDAAKRHIRKRARALGHPELIPDSWTAAAVDLSLIAVDTHDAPGWITNPRETQRLRNYWTKGEGAAKIRWGLPGDFNRCRRQLAKYVTNPEWLAGTCANLHYVALGFWPGQPPHGRKKSATSAAETPEGEAVTAAFLAAGDQDVLPPRAWFEAPPLTAATPMTLNGDEVIGHLATWGTCHVGIEGACTEAPHSKHGYAYFATGEMETDDGLVAVGQITMDTGHAPREANPASTVSHYDDTGTVVADVAAGEDDYGIWIHGSLRPGVTDTQRRALRAGALSGDWRRIAGNLELVAALVVNVPGFPIPRTEMAASLDVPLSLVAAGIVSVDSNAEHVADLVVARLDARDRRVATSARVATMNALVRQARIEAVLASVGR